MEDLPTTKALSLPSFRQAISLILFTIIGALILQQGHNQFGVMGNIVLSLIGISGLAILAFSKKYASVLDSPYFAISILITIALGTAKGTFITQAATNSVFEQRYGESGSAFLRAFQLHDVFHSWWYVGLFVLLAFSLIKISARKKFTLPNLGFHLAHLSPILILGGFWADYFFGYRGIIQLEEGQRSNVVRLFAGHSNYLQDSTLLGFSIRLDNFEFEKHDPDYRIQIWKRDSSQHAIPVSHGGMNINQKPPIILASLPLEAMKIRHIYGTDLYFRMAELYPDFSFKYTYPLLTEAIEPVAPGIQIDMKTALGDGTLQLLANKPNRSKVLDETIFGGWIEFYWEMPDDVKTSLEPPISNTANRIIFTGKDSMAYYVIDGQVRSERLVTNEDFVIPTNQNTTLHILHIFPDASLLKAEPSSAGNEMLNPVAKVEIWHKGKSAQEAFIYPGKEGKVGGQFNIPGSPFFLAMESIKDQEAKFYKSEISVLNSSEEATQQQSIKVNEPMLYQGHRFYQTDYNPERPNYSGIGVTYNPGLYLIYGGFYLMVAGVGWMFYSRGVMRNGER